MNAALLDIVRCPACGGALSLAAKPEGALCDGCGSRFGVRNGILDLHPNPVPSALQEMEAHQQLAARWLDDEVPAHLRYLFHGEHGRKIALALPNCAYPELTAASKSLGRIAALAGDYFALLDRLDLTGREIAVEIGAHTGWSAQHLAKRCQMVTATDISPQLEDAQVYLENGAPFERVFADMQVFPFSAESLDLIFGVATIHHADNLLSLFRRFRETLKPGGRAVFLDEPVAGRWDRKAVAAFGADEKELGIQEHIYTIHQYFAAARQADLVPSVLPLPGLCLDNSRRWPRMRRMTLRLLRSRQGYRPLFTRRVYPFLLKFYPRIPFPRFALVLTKVH